MKKSIMFVLPLILVVAFANLSLSPDKDQIEKLWYNQEKSSKIQIYLAVDGKYYGKIYWLKVTTDKDTGKPRTDKENPDKNMRSTPLLNLLIMKGFAKSKDNPNEYTDGTIYDPKNGKTYCGKIAFKGNTLDLRGYICKLPFLGRTETWTLAEGQ